MTPPQPRHGRLSPFSSLSGASLLLSNAHTLMYPLSPLIPAAVAVALVFASKARTDDPLLPHWRLPRLPFKSCRCAFGCWLTSQTSFLPAGRTARDGKVTRLSTPLAEAGKGSSSGNASSR
ncbi:unnamed protein product, partial [Ectocarpus fasciculatus]